MGGGQHGQGLLGLGDGLHDLDGGQQAVAGVGVAAEDDVAGLLAADQVAVLAHVFGNVLVAHGGLFIADAELIERLVQAHVGHDGGDDLGIAEGAVLLHILGAEVHDMVAVDLVALLVHGEAAVGVAVKGEAHVEMVVDNELLEIMYMRRAAVDVDVQAVGWFAMT